MRVSVCSFIAYLAFIVCCVLAAVVAVVVVVNRFENVLNARTQSLFSTLSASKPIHRLTHDKFIKIDIQIPFKRIFYRSAYFFSLFLLFCLSHSLVRPLFLACVNARRVCVNIHAFICLSVRQKQLVRTVPLDNHRTATVDSNCFSRYLSSPLFNYNIKFCFILCTNRSK